MLSEKIKTSLLWCALLLLASGFSAFSAWKMSQLSSTIDEQKNVINQMKLEHVAASIAVNEAYQDKKEIYERAKDRLCEAEKKMGRNSDICDMAIPDDLRMLWEKSNPTTESLIHSTN